MNKTIKLLLWPLVLIRRWHDAILIKHNPEKMFSIWHKRSTGKLLNINPPVTLDDKIAYMEFHTDTTEWSRLADKIKVREYVQECGYVDILPKLYGVWDKVEDIDFNQLPDAFVIKTNNASATNILVRDKNKVEINSIQKQLNKWLVQDYGYQSCQPHYSRIKPMILAEEYLGLNAECTPLIDYKFYCVNGSPKYVIVYTDRKPNSHDMKRTIYDMNWNLHQEYLGRLAIKGEAVQKPTSFFLMKDIASRLSQGFPFVRVDFYEIEGKPIFGEMTFTPGMQETNEKFGIELGQIMVL